jgi:hypothetical protein
MSLEKIVCLYQLFRPKVSVTHIGNRGNCSICEYDPINNFKCSGYYPIKERIIIVIDKDKNVKTYTKEK